MLLTIVIFYILKLFFSYKYTATSCFGQLKKVETTTSLPLFPKKPDWVRKEIIRMKALTPEFGCRKLADSFNRRFAQSKQMTVGKTYVSNVIRDHQYEIQVLRNNIKHRKPLPLSLNLVWGIDLTGKTDAKNKMHNIFGILDHGSRATLILTGLKKQSIYYPTSAFAGCD